MKPLALIALVACTTPAPLAAATATASGTTACPPTAPILEVHEGHAAYDDGMCVIMVLDPGEVLVSGTWRWDGGDPIWWPERIEGGGSSILERTDGVVGWTTLTETCDGITARVITARVE